MKTSEESILSPAIEIASPARRKRLGPNADAIQKIRTLMKFLFGSTSLFLQGRYIIMFKSQIFLFFAVLKAKHFNLTNTS